MSEHGDFQGQAHTEWVVQPGADRDMVLLDHFAFIDPDGKTWAAPKGSQIDGASIPRPLWALIGSPYTGDYRRASIVHDVACHTSTNGKSRKAADKMFHHACRAGGCSRLYAKLLYLGVRLGSIWAKNVGLVPTQEVEIRHSQDEIELQEQYSQMAEEIAAKDNERGVARQTAAEAVTEVDDVMARHGFVD